MKKQFETELKVGLFITVGVGLVMLAILLMGGAKSLFTRTNHYVAHMESVEGLFGGAKVVLSGIPVGTVASADFDEKSRDIVVILAVQHKYEDWIRADTVAELATQGVLGDKFVSLTSGSKESPMLPDDGEIRVHVGKDLSSAIGRADQLMISLNSIAGSLDHILKSFESENRNGSLFENLGNASRNLSQLTHKLNAELEGIQLNKTVKNMNGIVEKINNGTGTLGALVNDPGLYDDAKALLGSANRNRIMRNLVRKTVRDAEEDQKSEEKANESKKALPRK